MAAGAQLAAIRTHPDLWGNMKPLFLLSISILFLSAACQATPTPESAATIDVLAVHTVVAQTMRAAAATQTPAPSPTGTPASLPTATLEPTPTPTPVVTGIPTMADVPIMAIYSGPGVRVLEQPVAVVRDGITLAVEQAAVYPDRVELVYTIRNLPAELLFDPMNTTEGTDCGGPQSYPSLLLPDGTLIPAVDYMLDGKAYDNLTKPFARGYAIHRFQAAVPADVQELKMTLYCIALARLDRAPLNWEIPFRVR